MIVLFSCVLLVLVLRCCIKLAVLIPSNKVFPLLRTSTFSIKRAEREQETTGVGRFYKLDLNLVIAIVRRNVVATYNIVVNHVDAGRRRCLADRLSDFLKWSRLFRQQNGSV